MDTVIKTPEVTSVDPDVILNQLKYLSLRHHFVALTGWSSGAGFFGDQVQPVVMRFHRLNPIFEYRLS
jgi:hypothetical protein